MTDWTTSDIVLLCVAAYVSIAALVRLTHGHRDKVVADLQSEWIEQQRSKAEQEYEEQKQRKKQQRKQQDEERRVHRRGDAA